jgi:perosamine synthetase
MNSLDSYYHSVTKIFHFLKKQESIKDAYLNAIPIDDEGFLLPLCKCHLDDTALIQKLTNWRNENVSVYPTQFNASFESTKNWLVNGLLDVEDRILFLVVNKYGQTIGHIGFNNCHNDQLMLEVDNVIRGERSICKGLFGKALNCMLTWARKTINCKGFILRVMDDNPQAIKFYEKNNFVQKEKIPLVKDSEDKIVKYRYASPNENPDKNFILMEFIAPNYCGKSMILTAGPSVSQLESFYCYDAALNGWNSSWSKYLSQFEEEFAQYVNVKYALATSSCTGALQIALMALEIGVGDEVIVPDQTWVATANAVRYVGATPVFADVELDSWNLDANSVEALITEKTKAIMPVHMYGHPARMTGILEVAKKFDLKVVEDAAPAIGAEWAGQRCGSFGDFAGFSFQGAKLLVTGEGGMLVTSNEELFLKAKKIWDQGRNANASRAFWIDAEGVKFKMSNVQAAVGLGQLQRVDELIDMKRRIFQWYEEELSDLDSLRLNKEIEGAKSIYWMSSILINKNAKCDRDKLMSLLKEKNIDTRPVFPAISQYPIWDNRNRNPQPNAKLIGDSAMNLPSGVCLSYEEIKYVAQTIKSFI